MIYTTIIIISAVMWCTRDKRLANYSKLVTVHTAVLQINIIILVNIFKSSVSSGGLLNSDVYNI